MTFKASFVFLGTGLDDFISLSRTKSPSLTKLFIPTFGFFHSFLFGCWSSISTTGWS